MAVHRDQIGTLEPVVQAQFYKDVMQGLSSTPKYLQSKYFYDAEGDRLFQQIMQLSEYYLTRCEQEIFVKQTKAIAANLVSESGDCDIIELGAGDATKSTHLLRYLIDAGRHFTYYPVDISQNVIQLLEAEMPQRIPGLQVQGLNGDYFDMIRKSYQVSGRRKVILFLGSNIGNFRPAEANRFLRVLNDSLLSGDMVLIGFDLKKHPKQILAAYDDTTGVTKAFNLNLLRRINRELGADFDLAKFDHYPTYDPISGACKSFLVSIEDQEVHIGDESCRLYRNECVWTELSQKYSEDEINELAVQTGFRPVKNFYDSRHWFLDAAWEKL